MNKEMQHYILIRLAHQVDLQTRCNSNSDSQQHFSCNLMILKFVLKNKWPKISKCFWNGGACRDDLPTRFKDLGWNLWWGSGIEASWQEVWDQKEVHTHLDSGMLCAVLVEKENSPNTWNQEKWASMWKRLTLNPYSYHLLFRTTFKYKKKRHLQAE